jgi:hypothetical protein
MFDQLNQRFQNISSETKEYIETSIEYYKLDAYKKTAKGTSALLRYFFVLGVFLLFFSFLMIGVALFLGSLLGDSFYGFFIVAGFNLLLFIILLTRGRKLFDSIVLSIFSEIFSDKP